jgi:hypothetical protein
VITQALLEAVVLAYIEAAMWSSTDDEGEPLDGLYEVYDLADDTNAAIHELVQEWLDLLDDDEVDWRSGWSPEQLGHDLWLTRNRHGAGYWDRYYAGDDLRSRVGHELTLRAHRLGESDMYVGDDGKLYVT